MAIHRQVPLRMDVQIDQTMPPQQIQHVIKKTHPRLRPRLPRPIQVHPHIHLRLPSHPPHFPHPAQILILLRHNHHTHFRHRSTQMHTDEKTHQNHQHPQTWHGRPAHVLLHHSSPRHPKP